MLKILDTLVGLFILFIFLKIFLPQEVGDLVNEIIIQALTMISDALAQNSF
jgi:hypothetical protein